MPRIEYKCGCEDITAPGQSSVKTSNPANPASKKAPVEAALEAAKKAVDAAIVATGSTNGTEPIVALTDIKTLTDSIEDQSIGLVKMINDLVDAVTTLGDNAIILLLNDVKEAIELNVFIGPGVSIITDFNVLKKTNNIENLKSLFNSLEKLKKALEAFDAPLKAMAGGKRKHTRRKHCKHGKNIMHCPYCKHSTKHCTKHRSKHSNKSKKGKKRSKRTRKVDRIARSLERSLERSLNESHNSKKSRRSRRKSK